MRRHDDGNGGTKYINIHIYTSYSIDRERRRGSHRRYFRVSLQ